MYSLYINYMSAKLLKCIYWAATVSRIQLGSGDKNKQNLTQSLFSGSCGLMERERHYCIHHLYQCTVSAMVSAVMEGKVHGALWTRTGDICSDLGRFSWRSDDQPKIIEAQNWEETVFFYSYETCKLKQYPHSFICRGLMQCHHDPPILKMFGSKSSMVYKCKLHEAFSWKGL